MIWHDLRIAARTLSRTPTFAITVILTLAIALGMATSVFTVVDALLVRPLPYKDAGRLALIWSSQPNESRGPVSFDDFEDWRRNSKTLDSAAVYSSFYRPVLSGSGTPERLSSLLVSHQYFAVMGVQPVLGRFFLPEEDRDGRDDIIVLSHAFWRARFHSDPAVVGTSVLLNARPHVIVGVAGPDLLPLPPSLAEQSPQIYRPIGEPVGPGSRDGRHLRVIARLRPGITIEEAQVDLDVRSRQMEREHPDVDAHLAVKIVPLRSDMTRNVRTALLSLQAAVLVLLLIACANVANMLLAKSSGRRREIAIREALGAGTSRLVRMLMSESMILGLLGGSTGLLLAVWGTAGMTTIAARVLPDAGAIIVNWRVLLFSLLLSIVASILFGLAPAFRLKSLRLDDALKSGGRVAGDRRNNLRRLLAAVQIALALVLLVATGLLGNSFLRLRSVEPGFDPHGILAASISLPQARYKNEDAVAGFYNRALAALRASPGVTNAAIVSVVPLSGDFDRTGFQIVGKQFGSGERVSPDRYIVSPSFFRTLHIPLLHGRLLTDRDDARHPPVCVISETAARQWFSGESPLGKKIRAGAAAGDYDHSPFREIVGVVGDIAQYGLGLPPTPQIYMPHAQFSTRYLTFLVRTSRDPSAIAGSVRQSVAAIDREQPLYDIIPLEDIVSNTIASRRLGLWLLVAFAFGALALASLGIYGVVSYSVAQRTSEFGIRIALGAQPAAIVREAIRDSLRITAAGLAGGVLASVAVARFISGFLFGVNPADALTFALVPLFLGAVAVVASYAPARRASRVDPVTALRAD